MRHLALIAVALLSQQTPVFRAGVDYVTVDVVVTGKDDVPVADLTKDDFEIVDRGKPQTIADFQYVSIPVVTRTIDLKAPRAPEADVATNIPAAPTSRQFVLVIDDLHIIETEIVPLKAVMTDFLEALSPDDEVAIVFVNRSDLSQNFTTDVGRMLRAVDRVRDALGFGLDAIAGIQGVDPDLLRSDPMTMGHARSAAMVLRNVAASIAGSAHGRRAIVFVSGGSPLDPTPNATNPVKVPGSLGILFDELNDTFEAARRAGVPIYTLDPRGVTSPDSAVRGSIDREGTRTAARQALKIQRDRLSDLAVNTGGRAFVGHPDLTRAVTEIVRENGSYYLLGYYPNPVDRDGKFHEIDVKVKRPGLRVRARYGYTAAAPGPAVADSKPALDKAIGAGVNVSGLSLRAFVAPLSASAKGMTAVVTIEVNYPAPADGSRRISDDLLISVIALDPDGKLKATSEQRRHFSGTAPEGQSTVTFLVDDVIELPSEPLTIRVGVASQSLGAVGTVQLPVDVPKPSDDRLQLSAVVVGLEGPARAGVMGAEAIADLVPFQPVTSRAFAVSDALRVFARLFWGSRDETAEAVVTLLGPGAPRSLMEKTEKTETLTGVPAGNRREAVLDTTLSLSDLTPGSYTLRVDARLPNGQTARREIPFSVR